MTIKIVAEPSDCRELTPAKEVKWQKEAEPVKALDVRKWRVWYIPALELTQMLGKRYQNRRRHTYVKPLQRSFGATKWRSDDER